MSISEQICYSTIRIESQTKDGACTGTGFFFNFLEDPNSKTHVPCIVTNKHVVEGAINGILVLTCILSDGTEFLERVIVPNFREARLFHPLSDVDLCIMPFQPIVELLATKGKKPFYIPLEKSLIPSYSQLDDLMAMEEIVMIGYPDGIWDAVNNKPILRRGITATHF